MKQFNGKFSIIDFAARLVLLTALMLRFIVPSGYMYNDATQNGAPLITICHSGSDSDFDKNFAQHSGAPYSKDKSDKSETCNFAQSHSVSQTPSSVIFALAEISTPQNVEFPRQNVRIGAGLAAPPPPSTGPPTLI